ncbi:hypothetical protein VPHD292_0059 [Vibrio phage D292]
MARLNKATKEKIVANAIAKSGVLNREAKNIKARAELADKCRIEVFGGKANLNKLIKAAEVAKEAVKAVRDVSTRYHGNFKAIFLKQSRIQAAFGGMQTTLYYNGELHDVGDCSKCVYRSPAPYGYLRSLTVAADHPLTKEWGDIEAEQKIINDIRENISINTWAILNSVTTDKKLIEVWPEALELIPKDNGSPATNLPTTDVKSLNEMIGIPTEKK